VTDAADSLAEIAFQRPDDARSIVAALTALERPDTDAIIARLDVSPDPDRSLRNLLEWARAAAGAAAPVAPVDAGDAGAASILLGSSQAVARLVAREPARLAELAAGAPPRDRNDVLDELLAELEGADEPSVLRILRHRRSLGTARILADDLCRAAPLEMVVRRVSILAELLIEAAIRAATDLLDPAMGRPTTTFAVLALGKLGGTELNYSSDVDLIFLYGEEGETTGTDTPLPHRKYFTALGDKIRHLLDDTTADGRAWRVDLRLRPEGSRGPIARSLASTLDYYRSMGRTWERQAFIKARAVAGDRELGGALIAQLEDFVWSRRLRASGIRQIRALKEQIETRAIERGGDERQVKEGRGGIRDIEFTVQFLQLLNGHDDARVRTPSTLIALRRLEAAGALRARERTRLDETYRFLRIVEHRLQTLHETPERRLPKDPHELLCLVRRIDPTAERAADPVAAFHARWTESTDAARRILDAHVHAPFRDLEDRAAPIVDAVLDPARADDAREAFAELHFRDGDAALAALRSMAREESPYLPRTRQFFAAVAPRLIRKASRTVDPDATLVRIARIIDTLGAKSIFFQLLQQSPDLLDILVDIAGESPYLVERLVSQPGRFDAFVDALSVTPEHSFELLAATLDDAKETDEEAATRMLGELAELELLRIGVRDIQERSNVRNVMEDLSRLAESVLDQAIDVLQPSLFARKGTPRNADGSPGRFAILGAGRLGASEMLYGSDLDLVFVHDADGSTDLDRPSAGVLTELAQAVIRVVGGGAGTGRIFEVDTRLRPDGSKGVLVPSIGRLRAYVHANLPAWERLALAKLRPVAGDPGLGGEAIVAIHDALYAAPPPPNLGRDIREMRAKMEETAGPGDLKRGPGGLVDVDFLVGALRLRYGHEIPTLRSPSTLDTLASARAAGLIQPSELERILSAYQVLQKIHARLRIGGNRSLDRLPDDPAERDVLARRLGYLGGEGGAGTVFAEEIRYFTGELRRVFDATLARLDGDPPC